LGDAVMTRVSIANGPEETPLAHTPVDLFNGIDNLKRLSAGWTAHGHVPAETQEAETQETCLEQLQNPQLEYWIIERQHLRTDN
jgi:hypothetical protein